MTKPIKTCLQASGTFYTCCRSLRNSPPFSSILLQLFLNIISSRFVSFLPSLSQIKLKSTPPLQFQLHPTHTMSSSSLVMPPPAVHSLMGPTSPTSPISLVASPTVSPPPQQQQHASPLQPASTSRFAAIRASSLGHFLQRKRKHTREAVQARIHEIGQDTQSLGLSLDTEALSIDGKSWDWWMDQDMRRITKRVRTEWGDTRYQQTKR